MYFVTTEIVRFISIIIAMLEAYKWTIKETIHTTMLWYRYKAIISEFHKYYDVENELWMNHYWRAITSVFNINFLQIIFGADMLMRAKKYLFAVMS